MIGDVSFGPRNKRLNRREALNVAEKALGEVGLDAALYAESNPLCLSGGQKRRAGFAGVLALQSAFLIFDEPTIGLDAFGVRDFLALLERQLALGRGVLVVTHELETFLPLAHAAVVLADGQIVGVYRRGTEPAGEDAYV